jgi:hypothetical protein
MLAEFFFVLICDDDQRILMHVAGLFYINETDESTYCDTNYTQYPCATGQEYYGRGPFQLTW